MIKKKYTQKTKKGQVFLPDFIFAFLIFALALTLSIKFIINIFPNQGYEELSNDAERISEVFMSQGAPINWTSDTVIKPGLLTQDRFDEAKFSNLSEVGYADARNLFSTKYDFFIFIQNESLTYHFGHQDVDVVDNNTVDISGINYENLIKIDRFIVLNDSIKILVVYVWD